MCTSKPLLHFNQFTNGLCYQHFQSPDCIWCVALFFFMMWPAEIVPKVGDKIKTSKTLPKAQIAHGVLHYFFIAVPAEIVWFQSPKWVIKSKH